MSESQRTLSLLDCYKLGKASARVGTFGWRTLDTELNNSEILDMFPELCTAEKLAMFRRGYARLFLILGK